MRPPALAFLLLTACVKPPPAVAPDAGVTKAAAVDAAPPLTLDEAKLGKWITYRANLRAAQAKLLTAEHERAESLRAADAGALDPHRVMVETLARRAAARDAAAKANGLTIPEAIGLDAMIFQVMGQRAVVKNSEQAKLLAQLKARLDAMHPEQRIDALQDVQELEATLKKMESADGLRAALGRANVDLILAHSAELMPLYEQALLDERTH